MRDRIIIKRREIDEGYRVPVPTLTCFACNKPHTDKAAMESVSDLSRRKTHTIKLHSDNIEGPVLKNGKSRWKRANGEGSA